MLLRFKELYSKQIIKTLETYLLHEEVKLPIYFAIESNELNRYYDYIENEKSNKAESTAFQTLMDSVISNGFQFVINSAQPKQILQSASDFQAVNLQAILKYFCRTNLFYMAVDN